jgi:hypothetical protein
MSLNAGDREATQGLTAAIYTALDAELRPPLEDAETKPEDITQSQEAWKKLSFAIATGVINHLKRDPDGDPEYAESFSSARQDPAYWNWLAGFAKLFNDWATNPTSTIVDLKDAIKNYHSNNRTPSEMKGVIR